MMNEMTDSELITITIEKYADLQRIKKANGNQENPELDYQIKITTAKLSSYGVSVEDITLQQIDDGGVDRFFTMVQSFL